MTTSMALERAQRPPSKITFQIETIDKEKAQEYLSLNFKSNRALRPRAVASLVDDMKDGDFFLSWDCIAFNEEGLLVNGQHRLSALIEADVTYDFCVVRNVSHETIKHFDTGNKRGQADRISVNGVYIHAKACAAVKLCLGDYKSNFTGLNKYSYPKYDGFVSKYYIRHSNFFENLERDGYLKSKYTNNALGAALKIYTEMKRCKGKYTEYNHEMTAYQRATFWLDLVVDGHSREFNIDYNTDQSPFKLKEKLVKRLERGANMYGQAAYKFYLIAAKYFMEGRSPNLRIENAKEDPFTNFRIIESTNEEND